MKYIGDYFVGFPEKFGRFSGGKVDNLDYVK